MTTGRARFLHMVAATAIASAVASVAFAQADPDVPLDVPSGQGAPRIDPPFDPDGPAPGRGQGFTSPGRPVSNEVKLVKRFDIDGDGRLLSPQERQAARAHVAEDRARMQQQRERDGDARGRGRGGPDGPPGGPPEGRGPGRGGRTEPTSPGPRVSPAEVENYPDAPLYDTSILRTLFIDFDSNEWEAELADFHNTDVEVPATLTVDGVKYPGVGVHFRGASSYMMVPAGSKRSLNVALDFTNEQQNLYGFRTLNLLNGHGDVSLMSSVLFSHIARPYIPAPRANHVRVVINGESWGVYISLEQFNKDFVNTHFGSSRGARWKVAGSPRGDGGLFYMGDDVEAYKARYEIKSGDKSKDWKALINLCKVLTTTPLEKLEAELAPILDIDGALWFLALDIGLVNSDGYWTRASDYSLFMDEQGKFHIIPHDMNESFLSRVGPPGGGAGRGGGGAPPSRENIRVPHELDPLTGMDQERKPLRSRLLAVPSLRDRYLENVRRLADEGLSWKAIGPAVAQWRALIDEHVKADTRKLSSYEAFAAATSDITPAEPIDGPLPVANLREFAEKRSAFLRRYLESHALQASSPGRTKQEPPS